MRIGFDLDGVLADLHGAYFRQARALFPGIDDSALASPSTGASPPEEGEGAADDDVPGPASRPALSRHQASAVWNQLFRTENFWETLSEIEPGALARLWELTQTRGWEIIFLTSRPHAPGRTLQHQTQRWIAAQGFLLPSVFIVPQSRGRIADALQLDAVVDDRPEGCLDVVLESKARGILVWRGDAASVPGSTKRLGIGVVPSIKVCLDVLVEADQGSDGDGLMGRLRRLLGLKPRTT